MPWPREARANCSASQYGVATRWPLIIWNSSSHLMCAVAGITDAPNPIMTKGNNAIYRDIVSSTYLRFQFETLEISALLMGRLGAARIYSWSGRNALALLMRETTGPISGPRFRAAELPCGSGVRLRSDGSNARWRERRPIIESEWRAVWKRQPEFMVGLACAAACRTGDESKRWRPARRIEVGREQTGRPTAARWGAIRRGSRMRGSMYRKTPGRACLFPRLSIGINSRAYVRMRVAAHTAQVGRALCDAVNR